MNDLALHHIGIKVPNIDLALGAFSSIGISCHEVVDCPEVGLRIACLALGNIEMELLEVVGENSPIAKDPPGFHHIAVATKDVDMQYQLMKESELCEVQGQIRRGLHNNRLFFFRLIENPGTLYECVEPAEVHSD